jgi:hypothetical protein
MNYTICLLKKVYFLELIGPAPEGEGGYIARSFGIAATECQGIPTCNYKCIGGQASLPGIAPRAKINILV